MCRFIICLLPVCTNNVSIAGNELGSERHKKKNKIKPKYYKNKDTKETETTERLVVSNWIWSWDNVFKKQKQKQEN